MAMWLVFVFFFTSSLMKVTGRHEHYLIYLNEFSSLSCVVFEHKIYNE